jgi:hypothetical protein
MSTLAELQREMQAHVLHGDGAAYRAIDATRGASAAERLHVYTHGYRARLLEILGNDFYALRALAGAEEFERLASAYIDATPSTHPNVRWYGGSLATFLRTQPPWSRHSEFADMAELEWAIGLAFDAADETVISFNDLAALSAQDWPCLRLRLHASVQRRRLAHNVDAMRRAIDRDEALPESQAAHAPAWIAWRDSLSVRHRRLEDDEAAALAAVADGATFAELCERLCEWHAPDAVALRAASLLRRWIDEGWIAAFDIAVP